MRDKEERGLLVVERMDVEIFKAEVDGIHKKFRSCLPEKRNCSIDSLNQKQNCIQLTSKKDIFLALRSFDRTSETKKRLYYSEARIASWNVDRIPHFLLKTCFLANPRKFMTADFPSVGVFLHSHRGAASPFLTSRKMNTHR